MSESAARPGDAGDGADAGAGDSNVWEKAEDESKIMMYESALEDLENRAVKQQEELIQTREKAAELEAALKEAQAKTEEMQQALQAKSAAYDGLHLEYQGARSKSSSLEESSKMNQERMDRLQAEGDNLREEISRLSKENNEYKAKMTQAEAQSKLDDSSVLPLQFQVQRLQNEIDTVQAHSTWLEEELRTKSEELSHMKVTHAAETAHLRGQANVAVSEKESAEIELNNLRQAVGELQKKNGILSRDVFEAKQEAIDTKASTEEELVASRRVADLQKQQLERLQQRYDGMAKQLQALKDMAEQAEKENENQWKERELEIQAASKRVLAEQAAEYQKKIAEMQEKINEANRRCKKAEDGLLRIEAPPVRRALPSTGASMITGSEGGDEEPLNLTDLYQRVAQAEDDLNAEVTRRTKVEIKFARLEAEIEASAPIFQQQRQECEVARERLEEYKKRTEHALNDAASARNEASMLQAEMSRLKKKNEELADESKVVAKQVQDMLMSRSSGVENPAVPQTVAQMQGANARLLTMYSQLERRNKELEEKLKADDKSQEIEQYKELLESLQADRQRQETMVTSIVQQRDLYRALVMKTDATMLGNEDESSALEIVKRQSVRSNALQDENKKIHNELTQAKAQLDSLKRDKDIASERLQRYEALNSELTSTVDRFTLEISSSKAAMARSEAKASYHKEKVGRLEESLQRNREEINQVTSSKTRLMELNAELERAISKANAECSKLDAELRQTKSKLHLAEAQAESAKAAEKRISDEAVQLRGDLSRQGAMIESIQRIESSLSSRNNSEIESYKAEITALREQLSGIEAKSATTFEDLKGKVADLELQIRELETSRAKSAKEALEAKNESVDSLKKMEEATKKAAMLEAQLKTAKKRLGDTSDDQDTEADIRSKLASVTADLESSKKQVEKWKERAATYERLAKDNESAVAETSEASSAAKKALDEELSELREELEQSNIDMLKRKEVITELTNDLSAQRSEREKAVNEVRKQVSALKADVEKYKKTAEVAEKRFDEVHAELSVLQADLSEAQSNYERELALHATARSDLRHTREDCEKESRLRLNAEQEASRIKGEFDMQQSLLDAQKSKHQEEMKLLEKRLEDSRAQNSLLHTQLEKITEQIDRMRSGGMEEESGGESKTEDILGSDEVSSLRRNASELRELVKFVRSEKDAIQAQLDAARRATDRERTKAAITQRNLDDARAELNAVREASIEKAADANALSERLKSNEEQCRLLKDSNAHLQQQVLELQKKLTMATEGLQKAKMALQPAEKLATELQSDKAALLAEKDSLTKEIESWKNRVQSLVSRFNQVDPEEHKKLLKKAEELEKQVKDLQSKKLEAEDETKRIRGLASRASTQLTQNKQLVENHKKTIAKLTAEKEAIEKSQTEGASKKDVDDLKESMAKLEKERKNEAALLKGANEMNEKLRDRLRQFQKTIQSLQKEKTDLSDRLIEANSKTSEQKRSEKTTHGATEESAGTVTATAAAEATAQSTEAQQPVSSVEKVAGAVPPEPTKPKGDVPAAPAEASETSTPKIPPGGFNFGPSEIPSTAQPSFKKIEPEKKLGDGIPKKRPAETSQEDQPVSKKPFGVVVPTQSTEQPAHGKDVSASDALQAFPKPSPTSGALAERRSPGEIKEMSMKEKLLEKKRRLMDKLKKKAQESNALQEAAKSSQQSEEPEAKKAKTDPGDSKAESSPKPSAASMDPKAKPFVPKILEGEVAMGDKQDKVGNDTEDGEMKKEKDVDGAYEESKESKDFPKTNLNPFGFATSSGSVFGSGAGAKPAIFGSIFGSGATTPAFGQTSGFGSGTNSVFGSTMSPGTSAIFGGAKKPEGGAAITSSFGSGSSLLNLKPPGSSSAPPVFSFGTSSNIKLPTPATSTPSQGGMFNAFTSPFGSAGASSASAPAQGGTSAKPLFSKEEENEESKGDEGVEEEEEGEMDESEQK